jgi:hypothetical protein
MDGTYDVGTHRPQKAAALLAWERRLMSIVEPTAPEPNVIGATEVEQRRRRRKGRARAGE